jgi:hypothetical protein
VAVSPDPASARQLAWWWVSFYLTSMGPLYARTLRAHGLGEAVGAVLGSHSVVASNGLPHGAEPLLDELTLWGDATAARQLLDRWYAAGADMPVIVLPPGRALDELDHMLEDLRPRSQAQQAVLVPS